MSSDELLVNFLGSEEVEQLLATYESIPDIQRTKELWTQEGWRFLRHEEMYTDRIPLWVVLDACQIRFSQLGIFFGLLKETCWFEKGDESPFSIEEIEIIISHISDYANAVYQIINGTEFYTIKHKMQRFMSQVFRLETHRATILSMIETGSLLQQKETPGLPLISRAAPAKWITKPNTPPISRTTGPEAVIPTKDTAPMGEKLQQNDSVKSDLFTPSKEEALQIVGGWSAVSPDNRDLQVGLLLMQGKKHHEVYSIAIATDVPPNFKQAIQYKANKFLEFAQTKGYDLKQYVKR